MLLLALAVMFLQQLAHADALFHAIPQRLIERRNRRVPLHDLQIDFQASPSHQRTLGMLYQRRPEPLMPSIRRHGQRVQPPAMPVIPRHNRPDDDSIHNRHKEQPIVHRDLLINRQCRSIMRRVIPEYRFPESNYLLAMSRINERRDLKG